MSVLEEHPTLSEQATVLVVDDEQEVADLYATWLDDQYRVRTAYDGEGALEQLDPEVDVVLLDRRMPGMNGDEVLGRIRERDEEYRVAMVTAVDPDFDILKLDVDEYVTKPVSEDDLVEVVEQLLTRGEFETDLQRAMTLAAKKTALENQKSSAELENNPAYNELTAELAEYRGRVNDQLTDLAEPKPNRYFPYAKRHILLNSIVISAVSIALLVIHLGIPDAQQRILGYGSPRSDPLVMYLLTFVHINDTHLYGNVLGYLLGAFFTFALCIRIRAVRWFYLTGLLLLTVLPPVTVVLSRGLLEILFPGTNLVLLGFSTVVAAFVGFAFLALLLVARTIYDHRIVFFTGAFIFLVLVDILLWANNTQFSIVAGIATVIVFAVILKSRIEAVSGSSRRWRTFFERLASLLVATAFFAVFGLGLFPTVPFVTAGQSMGTLSSDTLAGPASTNVFAHFLGVILGFVIAFMTAFIANIFPIRERIRRGGHALPERLL